MAVESSLILSAGLILLISFSLMLSLSVPIVVCIVGSSLATLLLLLPLDIALFTAAQKMITGLDGFTLLAVPFFMLAGAIMNSGGIAIKLVDLAKIFTGRIPGSLAHSNIVGNLLFGSISGSAVAASMAIGGAIIPLEEKEGYDLSFAAAVNTASAPVGMLIPPTASFIIYSLVSGGTSIAALFLGGYTVGLVWALSTMVVAYIIAKKRKYATSPAVTLSVAIRATIDALPALLLIIIVMGGIIGGIFTAIEGAAVSVIYSLFLALIWYRTLSIKEMPKVFILATKMTGVIMFILSASAVMSFAMAFTGLPVALSNAVISLSDNKYMILLLINISLLLIGAFIDIGPAIIIFTPIFLPIAQSIGVSNIHFGLIIIYNLCIGTITPPVGTGLFVGSTVAKVKVEVLIRSLIPFYLAIIAGLMLVTYSPAIALFLPNLIT